MTGMDHRRILASLALAGALLPVAACAQIPTAGPAQSASSEHSKPIPSEPGSRGTSALVIANGHGWTEAGLDGAMPAPNSCHYGTATNGGQLPDPSCTPGSIDPTVTQSNIDSTLGRSGGYTSSVRPPAAMTDAAKKKVLAAYGIPASQSSRYELDHLVPLCAAGSSNLANLWPEANTFLPGTGSESSVVHNSKDRVEEYVCQAIREHQVQLAAAQKALATDWTAAVQTLGLPSIPDSYKG
ncbi:hypothetical protein [Sinomonas gamaensis]|uniref:hypothetical protein n=1 Tax=Sinomonas gamaensis TaxID=2565624 RepID=UPI00110877B5|nr:hypothetical protein [Sinomonas gamaensis]